MTRDLTLKALRRVLDVVFATTMLVVGVSLFGIAVFNAVKTPSAKVKTHEAECIMLSVEDDHHEGIAEIFESKLEKGYTVALVWYHEDETSTVCLRKGN